MDGSVDVELPAIALFDENGYKGWREGVRV